MVEAGLEIRIEPDAVDAETSHDLQDLAETLSRQSVLRSVAEQKVPAKDGQKDAGLTTAIEISTLLLTAVTTLLQVLQFWLSSRPKYTAELSVEGVKFTIESNDPKDLAAKLRQLPVSGGKRKVEIVLKRNS